jgi:hypothetical protein
MSKGERGIPYAKGWQGKVLVIEGDNVTLYVMYVTLGESVYVGRRG